jgi:hypothetical protein
MPPLRLGVSLQPRWPLDDGTAGLRAARHAEALGFDHVAVGNRLLDSGVGLAAPTPASVADDLGKLAETGLTACTLWLPIAAEHMEPAMEWIAAEVVPRLTR